MNHKQFKKNEVEEASDPLWGEMDILELMGGESLYDDLVGGFKYHADAWWVFQPPPDTPDTLLNEALEDINKRLVVATSRLTPLYLNRRALIYDGGDAAIVGTIVGVEVVGCGDCYDDRPTGNPLAAQVWEKIDPEVRFTVTDDAGKGYSFLAFDWAKDGADAELYYIEHTENSSIPLGDRVFKSFDEATSFLDGIISQKIIIFEGETK